MFDPNDGQGAGGGNNDGGQHNGAPAGNTGVADNNNAGAGGGNNGGLPNGFKVVDGNIVNAAGKRLHFYEEDRTDFVPRTRLNGENPQFKQRLTAAEQRAVAAEQALEAERKRVRALAGLETPSTEDAQRGEVKKLILEMFPELGEISSLKEQNQTALSQAQAAQVAHWERHSHGMIAELEQEVASVLGVEKLSAKQSKQLRQAYIAEAQDAVNERFVNVGGQWYLKDGYDFSSDFMSRHEAGDKALIKEFAKGFVGEWFEPARRQVTSQAVRRFGRAVPSGARSGQPVTKTPAIDYNDENAFKKALLDARRGGGSE
jgi:hypothetical protein